MDDTSSPSRYCRAALLAAAGLVASPAAASESCWQMDDATLHLAIDGAERVLRYKGPPDVLADLGVQPGALLFSGREEDGSIRGTAHAASATCPEADVTFPVEGRIDSGRNRITLRGLRPLLSQCLPDGTVAAESLVLVRQLEC